ncbi:MAG TPA: Hsp20/alpha crystallin family protein [Natronosporangium sp.]
MTALVPRLFGELTDWFETDFPLRPFRPHDGHLIRVEDARTEHEYIVRAELPGVDPDQDIQVLVDEHVLTILAERRERKQEPHHSEFRYGMLRRSVRLPAGADAEHITATYDKGVLTVTVPLTRPASAGRKIPITVAE